MSRKHTALIGTVLLAKALLLTGCDGGGAAPNSPAQPANVPGKDFSIADEHANKDKLKDAIPKTK